MLAFSDDRAIALGHDFIVNALCCSVVPLPLAAPLVAVGAIMFGLWLGLAVNVLSATCGAYLALLITRVACSPLLERLLGRHAQRWQKLDSAMLADGPMLALLLRLSPLSPFVVTNVLLSLTSISHTTYLWRTLVGVTPGSLPYAYAARLGASLYDEFPPRVQKSY